MVLTQGGNPDVRKADTEHSPPGQRVLATRGACVARRCVRVRRSAILPNSGLSNIENNCLASFWPPACSPRVGSVASIIEWKHLLVPLHHMEACDGRAAPRDGLSGKSVTCESATVGKQTL
jgi:hypothetical protein